MVRVLALLLLFIAVPLASADPIFFNVTLSCSVRKNWCITIRIYEADPFWQNDLVEHMWYCSDKPSRNDYIGPKYQGNDGLFGGKWYEFGYDIQHSCSSNGVTRCINTREETYAPIDGPSLIQYEVKLDDIGYEKICYPKFY